jgi:hypothetical protein
MAFGKRSSPAVAATTESPASPAAEKVAALTDRRDSLARRREAVGLEAEELRRNLDAAAAAGAETSRLAEELVATEGRSRAISLELAAVGKALDGARAVVAGEEAAARKAALERDYERAAEAFAVAERRFRAGLRSLSDTVGPVLRAHRDLDRAAAAAGRPARPFYPERADEELRDDLRRAGADTEVLGLAIPYTT